MSLDRQLDAQVDGCTRTKQYSIKCDNVYLWNSFCSSVKVDFEKCSTAELSRAELWTVQSKENGMSVFFVTNNSCALFALDKISSSSFTCQQHQTTIEICRCVMISMLGSAKPTRPKNCRFHFSLCEYLHIVLKKTDIVHMYILWFLFLSFCYVHQCNSNWWLKWKIRFWFVLFYHINPK